MSVLEITLIGVALSMDAFALTIANCATYRKLSFYKEMSMPLAFGLFQFLMPVIGFYIGSTFSDYVSGVAGYITAGIFFVLGGKIIYDNLKNKEEEQIASFSLGILIVQAIATSIDALAVGITFSVSLSSPFFPSLLIGVVTFVLVSLALIFGKYLGKIFGKYAQWLGATILIALAIKNLVSAIV